VTAGRPPSARRQAAFRFGVSAEARASFLLAAKGYRELARRWKSPVGEVDLVVLRGRTLVFVEVKGRGRLDDAAEAVHPRQRRRIVAAAEAWLAVHPEHAGYDIRFDAVLVAPGRLPRHLMAAFDAED
jgi:putative endonuclease